MNDTPHPDGHDAEHLDPGDLLASGHLDGTLTPDEQAQIDADPHLVERATRFHAVRQLLAAHDTEPPSHHRDRTVAAALAEFDTLRAGSRTVITSRRWHRSNAPRFLTAAAAAVVLGIVGVSALGGSSDDSDTAFIPLAAEQDEALSSAETVSLSTSDRATDPAAPTSTIGAINGGATAAITIDDPQELLALIPAADTAVVAGESDAKVASVSSPCVTDAQQFLADVIYQGVLAVAVLDPTTGVVRALDANCSVILEVGP